ncbi:GGDEF domain-containing protein [Alkalimonas amylolytica]|uniref:Diguanylate cyclase (GGDEF) domain-containing protein n=1 Tax=Alkalimonas amylolytica TaxID=152573 RepID=A0A1H4DXV4_ALKAM|nr:GGDEF domain-containing protein [Alkalimonas amylolytica]SEA77603.1 diguanylate cyclase (GGDEF) domain-containing protein [Alkalimonas amylolytica]
MLFQSVHTAGSAIYLVYFFLLLIARRIPRTNPGCSWWAAAIFFACLARLAFLGIHSDDMANIVLLYSQLVLLEKLMLLIGISYFFGPWLRIRSLIVIVLLMQLGLLLAHLAQIPSWLYTTILAVCNALCIWLVIVTVWRGKAPIHPLIRQMIILFASLLMLHWLLYVPISRLLLHDWRTLSFIIGTGLVVLLYTSLIGAVLSMFQRRLQESESKALDMAYKDPLTGLSNKRYIDSLFGQALQLATRPHQLLAVCYIDLDHFKPINDQAGHKAGDLVLKEVATRLKSCLRSTDICARIGGDEFVVVVTQLEQDIYANEVAKKILHSLNMPFKVGEQQYQLGASIGISLYPDHGKDFTDLLEKADQAMYQMKHSGRGGYCLYQPQS